MAAPVEIFCCYARKDQSLLNDLKAHLMPLQREGLITLWADTDIGAGTEWEKEIEKHLNTAQIILLLISPDFMNSEYCYSKEMQRAIERHEQGEARVIPIILRHVYWQGAPFGKLQTLPTDTKPVASSGWHSLDEAYLDVTKGIRKAVSEFLSRRIAETTLVSQSMTSENMDEEFNTSGLSLDWNEGRYSLPEMEPLQPRKVTMRSESSIAQVGRSSSSQTIAKQEQDSFDLQQPILIAAVLDCFLLLLSSFVTVLTPFAVILAILIFVFALYQVAVLEQWGWFLGILVPSPLMGFVYLLTEPTSTPLKQYLLMGLFLLSPLAVIVYGWRGPKDKPVQMLSYAKLKHLIFFISATGIIFLICGSLSFAGVLPYIQFGLYTSVGFIFAGFIFTIIQLIRLKQYDLINSAVVISLGIFPVFALGFTAGEIIYLFVWALAGIAYGIRGPTSVPPKPIRKKPINPSRSQKRKG